MTNFEREYDGEDNLRVVLTRDEQGTITAADLTQAKYGYNQLQLEPFQLYGLVDAVAGADPEEWRRRFPDDNGLEGALLRLRERFKRESLNGIEMAGRSKGPVRSHYLNVAEGLRQAMFLVQEELEELYRERQKELDELYQEDKDEPIAHVQRYTTRRRA